MKILSSIISMVVVAATLVSLPNKCNIYDVGDNTEPAAAIETINLEQSTEPTMVVAEPEEIVIEPTEVAKSELPSDENKDDANKHVGFDEVPLINQKDYPNDRYGWYGSISTHGCGIVSLAMVASYLTDEWHDPVVLAEQFADYNTERGSKWILFPDSAEILGLEIVERTYDWKTVRTALEEGHVVIALYGPDSYFTDGGHFVVLTGINENDRVTVNDPYGGNYNANIYLIEGFTNGFEDHYVRCGGGPFWIYAKKGENPIDYQKLFEDADVNSVISEP